MTHDLNETDGRTACFQERDDAPQQAEVALPWGEKLNLDFLEIIETINRERKKVEQDREALEKEKLSWVEQSQKLTAAQIGECITLNVGGTQFACSVDLLRKVPDSFFAALVSGRWELQRQKDGSVFIDREPTVFHLVMTYLRKYGSDFDMIEWHRTMTAREKLLLKDEAKFYILPDLLTPPEPPSCISDADWKVIDPNDKKRTLIYKWSVENPSVFPTLTQPNLVVVARCTDGAVLGGFTSVAWNTDATWKNDPSAALFCKASASAVLMKYGINIHHAQYGISRSSDNIAFGGGYDLRIQRTASKLVTTGSTHSFSALPLVVNHESTEMEIWRIGE